ncbi:MAG: 2-C-methyl-D-erythritol 4-phosphate cytidylyltransferase [Euzebyales bacterium]|nr:2-C-methyl-D-erythritol 4-phosphate cytidylyltransferase [Euzebyales bacterium]MBA3621925.1 2-C-methyl-D-erythritol 4-phosphate cytidylyltransferase [Euzebyales bacterium]
MTGAAIVVAAGSGERLAVGSPKALVALAGQPLLVHSLRALATCQTVTDVVVVLPPEANFDRVAEQLRAAGVPPAALCPGGATRQESVSRGLECCPSGTQVVAVHDAARPLVSPRLIDRTVAALQPPWDAVAPGLPVTETLKLVDATRQGVLRTVDRRGLWTVQTPQVFGRITLERVHARVATAAEAATDDLSLVERAGGRVRLIEGERRNFKITYPEDLALAEALLAGGGGP